MNFKEKSRFTSKVNQSSKKNRINWSQLRPSKELSEQKPKKVRKSLQYVLLLQKFDNVIDYKNIKLLKAFLSKEGKILSRRKTRINVQKQTAIGKAVRKARAFRLLPFTCDVCISL